MQGSGQKSIRIMIAGFVLMSLAACSGAQAQDKIQAQDKTQVQNKTQDAVSDLTSAASIDAPIGWEMDEAASFLRFTGLQEGDAFQGEFKDFTAQIIFNPDDLDTASVRVTVPLAKVDAGSTDRNSTLPGKAWFWTKKFPEAIFEAQNFTALGDNQYQAQGTLEIKGIKQPLTLPFALDIDGETAVMTCQLSLDRRDWEIGKKPWDTDEWVGLEVGLDIKLAARRAP